MDCRGVRLRLRLEWYTCERANKLLVHSGLYEFHDDRIHLADYQQNDLHLCVQTGRESFSTRIKLVNCLSSVMIYIQCSLSIAMRTRLSSRPEWWTRAAPFLSSWAPPPLWNALSATIYLTDRSPWRASRITRRTATGACRAQSAPVRLVLLSLISENKLKR